MQHEFVRNNIFNIKELNISTIKVNCFYLYLIFKMIFNLDR